MVLTWNKGYEDYTDTANWEPRYEELCRLAESVTVPAARQLSDEQLLETLEQLEELMRFYCVENNMAKLEPVMRKFNDLMTLCRDRHMSGIEPQYLEVLFLRINAMLYRAHGQHKQGADGYDKCVAAAEKCFAMLRKAMHLSSEQTFFVGWACIECCKEAAEAHDAIMDAPGTMQLMQKTIPMLEWADKWLADSPGICDQAAELYAACAGVFYQYGDAAGGNSGYRQAVRLFNLLDKTIGSDFYRARAIWMLCLHGTMAFLAAGDASLMLQCEKEAAEYLIERPRAVLRDKTIVESAQALISLQRSTALQQSGNLEAAINLAKNAVAQLDTGLAVLQEDYEGHQGYYQTVLSRIVSRISSMCVGSKETLGVMYYQNGEMAASEKVMQDVLEELTKTTGPRITGSGAVLIQSEALEYLALIASENGDVNQADFYGTQSADLASSLAESSGNSNAWVLTIASSSLVAELALAVKNKAKAAQYAERGLSACDMLAQAVPNHPHLALRGNLEKIKRKANRRFF